MAKDKKQKPEIVSIESILGNPSDKSKLLAFIKTAVESQMRMDLEKEQIKTTREDAKETIGLDPKMFNFLVKEEIKNSQLETKSDLAEKEYALEALYGNQE